MKLLSLLFFFFLTACSTTTKNQIGDGIFRCDYLVGNWSGSYISEKWGEKINYVIEFHPHGVYRAVFDVEGSEEPKSIEVRTWFCDGKTFGTFLVSSSEGISPEEAIASHKVYQIIELSSNYRKYKTLVGNEPGKVYELYKDKKP
jgi:hypothetical protein